MKFKEQNFTQAGAILLVSAILVKLISALFKIPLSADYALGDLGFGYFSVVYDLYSPIYGLALSGFPVAIARMVADFTAKNEEHHIRRIYYISLKALLLLGTVGAFAFFAIALLSIFDKSNDLGLSFAAVSPAVLFCCMASVYRGYFEGKKNMIPTAASNIIEALGKLFLGLTGAIITMRFTGEPALASAAALFGIAIGSFCSALYLKLTFKHQAEFTSSLKHDEKNFDKKLVRNFLSLLIPIAIGSLSVGITAFIDSLTLRGQLESMICGNKGNSALLLKDTLYSNLKYDEIPTLLYGIKGKAHTLFNLVPTLTTAFGVSAVPLITECFAKKDKEALRKNTNFCLKFSSCLSFPIAAGFMAIGVQIMELLYGENSAVLGGKLLAIYGISVAFGGMTVPTTALLQAIGRQRSALTNIAIGLLLKLSCSLFLVSVPEINVYGAAIGTAVCFVAIFIFNICGLVRGMGVLPDIKLCFVSPFISAVLCGITAFSVAYFCKGKAGTVLAIFFAAMVYLISVLILKVITKNEIKDLVKI